MTEGDGMAEKVIELGLSSLTETPPWAPKNDRDRVLLKTLSEFYKQKAWENKAILRQVILEGPYQKDCVALIKAVIGAKLWSPRVLTGAPFRLTRPINDSEGSMVVVGKFPLVIVRYQDKKPEVIVVVLGSATDEEIAFMAYAGAWKFGKTLTGVVCVGFDPPTVTVSAHNDAMNDLRDRTAAALERVASERMMEDGMPNKKKQLGEAGAAAVRKAASQAEDPEPAAAALEKELEELEPAVEGEPTETEQGETAIPEEPAATEEPVEAPTISESIPLGMSENAPPGVLNPGGVSTAIRNAGGVKKKDMGLLASLAKGAKVAPASTAKPAARPPQPPAAPAKPTPKAPKSDSHLATKGVPKIVITSDGTVAGTKLTVNGHEIRDIASLKFMIGADHAPELEVTQSEIKITAKKIF